MRKKKFIFLGRLFIFSREELYFLLPLFHFVNNCHSEFFEAKSSPKSAKKREISRPIYLYLFSIPNYEQFQPFSPPKPGHIVCQGTGEEYSIHERTSSYVNETTTAVVTTETNSNTHKPGTLLSLTQQKVDKMRMDNNTALLDDSQSAAATTNTDCNNSGDDTLQHSNGNVSADLGVGTTYNSDGTIDNTLVTSNNEGPVVDVVERSSHATSNDTTTKTTTTNALLKNDDEHFCVDAVQLSSTPKHAPYSSPTLNNDNIDKPSIATDSSVDNEKPHLQLNLQQGDEISNGSRNFIQPTATTLQTFGDEENTTKDSGISDMTRLSQSTTESISPPAASASDKQKDRSALSDEAKKWLGKHSVSSNGSVSSPGMLWCSVNLGFLQGAL